MRKRFSLILVIALALAVGVGAVAYAGRGGSCEGRGGLRPALTEEQREAVHAKVEEMREAGASPEEIHAAVKVMLEGWGIEVPEDFGKHPPRHMIFSQLTAEQREAVHAKVEEMRKAGASREEIHAAVREMLEGFGVELPDAGQNGELVPLGASEGQGARWGEIKGKFR